MSQPLSELASHEGSFLWFQHFPSQVIRIFASQVSDLLMTKQKLTGSCLNLVAMPCHSAIDIRNSLKAESRAPNCKKKKHKSYSWYDSGTCLAFCHCLKLHNKSELEHTRSYTRTLEGSRTASTRRARCLHCLERTIALAWSGCFPNFLRSPCNIIWPLNCLRI